MHINARPLLILLLLASAVLVHGRRRTKATTAKPTAAPTTRVTTMATTPTTRATASTAAVTTAAAAAAAATTTTLATSAPVTYSRYEQQALAQTNYYRARHCAAAMSLNADVKNIAQGYAQHLCDTNTFSHSGNTYQSSWLGENLFAVGGSNPIDLNTRNGSTPINTWYNEISLYNYTSPGFSSRTGHFTQLIWNASTMLGVGYCCTTDQLTCFVVANYFPGGNVGGGYVDNVHTPTC